ncbi:MAG TPA: class I SAM-dependent methyltransferase [Candidatus Krumholzibacteria bacterium]|nr:class I SAM-dependent methyltransferase [Candidatus Krumholzibacteria bacterium]
MDWYRVAFGEVYPLVYAHRDDAEARAVAHVFAGMFRGRAPVLDVACGAGRYTAAFGEAGIDTYGIDLSEFLLGEAVERRGLAGRVVQADMRCLPVRDASVAGAVNMFTSFGYFEDEADNARVIHEVARVLRPGGRFLMDFINGAAIGEVPAGATRREEEGAVIVEERELDAVRRVLCKHVRIIPHRGAEVTYSERVRLFSAVELEGMFAAAGLRVVARHGDYAGGGYRPDESPRMILLAERTAV